MLNEQDFPPLPSQTDALECIKSQLRPVRVASALNTNTFASFNDLPNELFLEILAYLLCLEPVQPQFHTLLNLSLTNRRLHGLVGASIYAAYNSTFCAPYPFLRTMISNPSLAALVRTLELRYGSDVHVDWRRYSPSIADKKVIKEGLKVMDIPAWKALATDCNEEETENELLYATILMHTPNVTSLTIDDGPLSYKTPKWLILIRRVVNASSLGHMHQFLHLKCIKVNISALKLRHLAPLLKLPSLRKLELVGLIELASRKEVQPESLRTLMPVNTSYIDDLSLQKCFINADALSVLLRAVRHLSRFECDYTDEGFILAAEADGEYHWLGPLPINVRHPSHPRPMLNYPKLAVALRKHSPTLNWLRLRYYMDRESFQQSVGLLGSLRDLVSVTDLEVPCPALVDISRPGNTIPVEHFPPSLTSLRITGIEWNGQDYPHAAVLGHMFARLRDCMPYLERLYVQLVQVDRSDTCYSYDWQYLQQSLAEIGVILFVEEPPHDKYWLIHHSDEDSDTNESDEESLYSN